MPPYPRQHLGELLLEEGKIRETDLQRALDERGTQLLGDVLVSQQACTEDDVLDALSRQLGIWRVRLSELDINPAIIAKVKAKVAAHYSIVPLYFRGSALVVASAQPQEDKRFEELKVLLGCPVKPMLCGKDEINVALKKYYGIGGAAGEAAQETAPPPRQQARHPVDVVSEQELTVKDLVDEILVDANNAGATDVHIEPIEGGFNIRTRVHGIMAPSKGPAQLARFRDSLVASVKVLAGLDVAEKMTPQSGRVKARISGKEIDLRVSVLPSARGETIHIKLFGTGVRYFDLTRLGMSDRDLVALESAIGWPTGAIIVAGPAASGKTTTLYAMLKRLRNDSTKMVAIEDPVELSLDGITQVEARRLPRGVEDALEHDPDVLVVGALSNGEDARAALSASQAGRKVLIAMTAHSSAEAIEALLHMDVPPYLIASALRCVVSQRLVRTLCDACKKKVRQDDDLFAGLWPRSMKMPRKVYENAGCAECGHTGFKGQTGIFEMMSINDDIREAIVTDSDVVEIDEAARGAGQRSLLEDGLAKVADGRTTSSEVLRVTPSR